MWITDCMCRIRKLGSDLFTSATGALHATERRRGNES